MNANFSTNGSSLEDCYTNTFALADLGNIKWRGFGINNDSVNHHVSDTLDCPVLSSYIKCLSRDILCVWRRLVNNNTSGAANKDTHSKHYTKQLWCFWFNIEPEWKQLIHKDLTTCEQGDYDHGLSYECRTLLFKAYHNLIEQSLVSIGFCKLGKYFIYPIENQQAQQQATSSHHSSPFGSVAAGKSNGNQDNPHFSKALQNTIAVIANSNRLACSFNFFIHGENSVCCIIDVRLKQPIYQITRAHLTNAQHQQQPIDAILSPFGLSALVTGNSFKESDNQVQKLINDWRKFFPTIQQSGKDKQPPKATGANNPPTPSSLISSIAPFQMETLEDSFNSIQKPSPWAGQANALPTMIEVAVAGVKMKYPSNFVFMLAPNELTKKRSLEHLCKEPNKKSVSSSQKQLTESQESVQDLLFTAISPSQSKDPSHSAQLVERSFKVSPRQPQLPTVTYCIRSNLNQELNCAPAVPIKEEPGESNDDIMQSLHRWDIYDVTCKLSCNCSRCKPKKSQKDQLKSSNQSLSKKLDKNNEKENKQTSLFKFNIPFHRRNFQLSQTYDLESSRTFLEVVTNEPGDKSALTNNNSINNSSQSGRLPNYFHKSTHQPPAIHKQTNGPPPPAEHPKSGEPLSNGDEPLNGKQNENSTNTQRQFEEEMFSPYSGDKSNTNSPNLAAVQWGALPSGRPENGMKPDDEKKAAFNETGDTVVVSSLKQINYFKAFRIGAIKRPHLPAESHLNGVHGGQQSSSLLYDFESINSLNVNWDVPAPKNQRLIKGVHDDPKSGHLVECQEDCSRDPYEFDDDCMRNSRNSTNDKTNDSAAKKDANQTAGNKPPIDKDNPLLKVLTREEDITVSYNGPDQIFDSDESNDMFSVPGAPSGNRHTADTDGAFAKLNGKTNNGNNNSANILCDIARMFPTPPSLEPNTAPSPYSSFINSDSNIEDYDRLTKENYPLSPLDNFKDIANVYSTPLQTNFIFSSKYSPLTSINISNLKIPDECNYKSKLEQPKSVPTPASALPALSNAPASKVTSHPSSHTSSNKQSNQSSKKPTGYTLVQSLTAESATNHHRIFDSPHRPSQFPATYPLNSSTTLFPNSSTSSSQFNENSSKLFNPPTTSSSAFQSSLIASKSQPAFGRRSALDASTVSELYGLNSSLPEINSLVVTLVLSDSMLSIFKDHNFNSCPLCICNMNIKGSDIDVYLPVNLMPNDEPQYKCSCGFSAIQNRHNSAYAGLFYEDEHEITSVLYDPVERLEKRSLFNIDALEFRPSITSKADSELIAKHDRIDPRIIDLLCSQCSAIFSSSSLLFKPLYFEYFKKRNCESSRDESRTPVLLTGASGVISKRIFLQRTNALLRSDSCEITFLALMLGRQGLEGFPSDKILKQYNQIENVHKRKAACVHEWIFENGTIHSNNYEVVQFLKSMQTLLQETVQRRLKDLGSTLNMKSLFKLLTWREFYKLTGRSEDQSEPQPIPSLLVAHDRDWIALSPFALKYWKECSLEPYSFTRDIGYLIICPDQEYVVNGVRSFFKDLSSVYQMLKLGKHKPIYKIAKDGLISVGKEKTTNSNSTNSSKEYSELDEWFSHIGNGSIAAKLKLYAQTCRQASQEHLRSLNLDKTIFEQHSKNSGSNVTENGSTGSSLSAAHQANLSKSSVASPLNSTGEAVNGLDKPNEDGNPEAFNTANTAGTHAAQHEAVDSDDDIRQPHVVIYMIEPFTFTNLDEDTYRVSCLGLLRCYLQMVEGLPENLRNNINLQVISLDSILQSSKDSLKSTRYDQLKSLAFSVFNQCRKVLVHQPISKSLTGFGPAASLECFLKSKDPGITNVSKIYMPPFILAPLKDKQTELGEMFGDRMERSQILFASYCLVENQKFIAVTCCNDKGDLVENSLINIQIPNRTKHRKASVIRFALQKLMDFLVSVMSESTQPWRLVLNKVGRVGHSELKEWANLLSKRALLKFSKQLKEKCKQCSYLPNYEMPSILSACFTSLEPDSNLRVFADQFTESETANSCLLSTPEEATTTHILVFPTSSTTQSSSNYPMDLGMGNSLAEDDIISGVLDDVNEDDLAVDDIFGNWDSPGSPGNKLGSPNSRNNAFDSSNLRNMESGLQEEEPCQLLQQPLSLGYYVSTAKTGKLPKWFWNCCRHLEDCNPSFLKSALLINTPSVHQVNDDLYTTSSKSSHPLDSHSTTDVLRYVLESYNSLSWLALDPSTHDRQSCLPLHIQLLMQLYHTAQALF